MHPPVWRYDVRNLLLVAGVLVGWGVVGHAQAGEQSPSCSKGVRCHGESCCVRLPVPAGPLEHVRDDGTSGGVVRVGAFELDKYEVTVGRVRAWVEAGMAVPAVGEVLYERDGLRVSWPRGARVQTEAEMQGWARYDTWARRVDDLPKNHVNWYTAAAFCHWEGGRLPTEVEWKYVATGGDERRLYPWGSQAPTSNLAVFNCRGDGRPGCSKEDILPVGSRPLGVGRWGHMDLAGSMFEWTLDHGQEGSSGTYVSRGGGFCYIGGVDRRATTNLRTTVLRREPAETRSHMVGFRCAYDAGS